MQILLMFQFLFFSFLIGFSGAITPGPVLTGVIKETPRSGWTTGPLVVFGHSITELILLIGLVLGLDVILKANLAEIIISLAGGIILFILAGLMLYDVFGKKISITKILEQKDLDEGAKRYRPIVDGFVLSLSNPFWILWWATIGISLIYTQLPPLTVAPVDYGFAGLTFFYVGHILADLAWYTFISVMLFFGRNLIDDRVYRVILVLCAGFLIYLGITFLINGITLLS